MPLGSSSAAPVMRPGPSCFSSGSRVAGLPAAAETAPSFSSFAVMAAVGKRRAAAVYGENPDESLNDPDDSNSSRLAQVLRQDVVGMAFLELGELALGFARLALGLELANVLEPLFRCALLGLGYGDTARQAGAGALERSCGFPKSIRARGWASRGRLRRPDRLLSLEDALGIGQGLCLFALAKYFDPGRDCRHACGLPCSAAFARKRGFDRTLFRPVKRGCGLRDGRRRRGVLYLDWRRFPRRLDALRLRRRSARRLCRRNFRRPNRPRCLGRYRVETGLPLEHHERQREGHEHGRGERDRRAPAAREPEPRGAPYRAGDALRRRQDIVVDPLRRARSLRITIDVAKLLV